MRPSKAVFSLHFSSAGKVPFLTSRAKICSRGALSWGWWRVQGHVSNHAGMVLGAKFSQTSFLHFKTFNKQVGHCIFTQQFKTSHFNYFIVPLLRIAANLSTLVYSLYYQNFCVHEGFLWVINLFIRIKYMWRKFSAKPMYICKLLPRVNHYAILAS